MTHRFIPSYPDRAQPTSLGLSCRFGQLSRREPSKTHVPAFPAAISERMYSNADMPLDYPPLTKPLDHGASESIVKDTVTQADGAKYIPGARLH
jgi:hypothetical protein